jgi:hypothetical protein
MKARPILFNGAMVRAVLSGNKTQTRRVIKSPAKNMQESGQEVIQRNPDNDPWYKDHVWSMRTKSGMWGDYTHERFLEFCPYGKVGDQLWVRETFQPIFAEGVTDWADVDYKTGEGYAPIYPATDKIAEFVGFDGDITTRCTPSIYMPRWASRIQLEITGVRVERLNDCSEADAMAEGCNDDYGEGDTLYWFDGLGVNKESGRLFAYNAKEAYSWLWESINGEGSWATNPWVWVIEFKVIKP